MGSETGGSSERGKKASDSEVHSTIGKGSRRPHDIDWLFCRLSRDQARARHPSVVFLVLVLLSHLGPKSRKSFRGLKSNRKSMHWDPRST